MDIADHGEHPTEPQHILRLRRASTAKLLRANCSLLQTTLISNAMHLLNLGNWGPATPPPSPPSDSVSAADPVSQLFFHAMFQHQMHTDAESPLFSQHCEQLTRPALVVPMPDDQEAHMLEAAPRPKPKRRPSLHHSITEDESTSAAEHCESSSSRLQSAVHASADGILTILPEPDLEHHDDHGFWDAYFAHADHSSDMATSPLPGVTSQNHSSDTTVTIAAGAEHAEQGLYELSTSLLTAHDSAAESPRARRPTRRFEELDSELEQDEPARPASAVSERSNSPAMVLADREVPKSPAASIVSDVDASFSPKRRRSVCSPRMSCVLSM